MNLVMASSTAMASMSRSQSSISGQTQQQTQWTAAPLDDIRLTEGQQRVLCVSDRLPCGLTRGPDAIRWHADEFELLEELYHGKTSFLHRARHKASGTVVALKTYCKRRLSVLNKYQVEREVRHHVMMHHPNIVALYAAFEDEDSVFLVQEYADGGDLFEAVKRAPGCCFTEAKAVASFLAPFLSAVVHIHGLGVLHRDIKPENILLAKRRSKQRNDAAQRPGGDAATGTGSEAAAASAAAASGAAASATSAAAGAGAMGGGAEGESGERCCQARVGGRRDAQFVVTLADFGLSICTHTERPVTRAGTLDYMAPEVLVCPDKKLPGDNKDKAAMLGYGAAVDAWACGVLAYELIVGRCPFEQETRSATYESIMYRDVKFPPHVSDEAKDFITSALSKSASARASVRELSQHPWILEYAPCEDQEALQEDQEADACKTEAGQSAAAAAGAGTSEQEAGGAAVEVEGDGVESSGSSAAAMGVVFEEGQSMAGSAASGAEGAEGNAAAKAAAMAAVAAASQGAAVGSCTSAASAPSSMAESVSACSCSGGGFSTSSGGGGSSSSSGGGGGSSCGGGASSGNNGSSSRTNSASLASSISAEQQLLRKAAAGADGSGSQQPSKAVEQQGGDQQHDHHHHRHQHHQKQQQVVHSAECYGPGAGTSGAPAVPAAHDAEGDTSSAAGLPGAAQLQGNTSPELPSPPIQSGQGVASAAPPAPHGPKSTRSTHSAAATAAAARLSGSASAVPPAAAAAAAPLTGAMVAAETAAAHSPLVAARNAATASGGLRNAQPAAAGSTAPHLGSDHEAAHPDSSSGGEHGHAHGLHKRLYHDADRRLTLGHDNISWDDFISTTPLDLEAAVAAAGADGVGGGEDAAVAAAATALGLLSVPGSWAGSFSLQPAGGPAAGGAALAGSSGSESSGGGSVPVSVSGGSFTAGGGAYPMVRSRLGSLPNLGSLVAAAFGGGSSSSSPGPAGVPPAAADASCRGSSFTGSFSSSPRAQNRSCEAPADVSSGGFGAFNGGSSGPGSLRSPSATQSAGRPRAVKISVGTSGPFGAAAAQLLPRSPSPSLLVAVASLSAASLSAASVPAASRSKSEAAELSAWLEDSIATAASSDAEEFDPLLWPVNAGGSSQMVSRSASFVMKAAPTAMAGAAAQQSAASCSGQIGRAGSFISLQSPGFGVKPAIPSASGNQQQQQRADAGVGGSAGAGLLTWHGPNSPAASSPAACTPAITPGRQVQSPRRVLWEDELAAAAAAPGAAASPRHQRPATTGDDRGGRGVSHASHGGQRAPLPPVGVLSDDALLQALGAPMSPRMAKAKSLGSDLGGGG